MAKTMNDVFPPPGEILELQPEELAIFLLEWLREAEASHTGDLNRHNFTGSSLRNYADETNREEVAKAMTEAWMWLEREGMIAPQPGNERDWVYVTERGKQLQSEADLDSYLQKKLLPGGSLYPVLARKVRPLFIRGDYETAVFQAFRELEIRVRKAGEFPAGVYGTNLMRKAFHVESGPLRNKQALLSERQATSDLFSGAIGLFKNPSSHREVNWEGSADVATVILLASLLMKIVDAHSQ